MLTGARVSIDICEMENDIIMNNLAREACYNKCCKGDDYRVWEPHLPYTNEYIHSSSYLPKDLLPSANVSSSHHKFIYTPQIRSYFVQPLSSTFRNSIIKPREKSQMCTIKDIMKHKIKNEIYL